ESQLGPRCEHQIVVVEGAAVLERHSALLGRNSRNPARNELDALAFQLRSERLGDRAAVPPADCDPRVRRNETERLVRSHERDSMRFRQLAPQLERGYRAADAGPNDDDVTHDASFSSSGGERFRPREGGEPKSPPLLSTIPRLYRELPFAPEPRLAHHDCRRTETRERLLKQVQADENREP